MPTVGFQKFQMGVVPNCLNPWAAVSLDEPFRGIQVNTTYLRTCYYTSFLCMLLSSPPTAAVYPCLILYVQNLAFHRHAIVFLTDRTIRCFICAKPFTFSMTCLSPRIFVQVSRILFVSHMSEPRPLDGSASDSAHHWGCRLTHVDLELTSLFGPFHLSFPCVTSIWNEWVE